jgi:DNA-binding transcriptional LysR family regulator
MTLEQLRIFVAVAECEHVTQGARQLNLTQSATSAAVAALEERYATKLFDRIGRRIALTEAGRLFLKEAKAVLARASAAAKVLTDLADLTRGSLALAASQTVANYWLPAAIQSYRLRYPGVIVSTTIGNSENVAAMVHEGSADLGLIEVAIDDPTLVIAPVAEDELILVAPLTHPWAARTPRSAQELKPGPWVLREPGSGTRSVVIAPVAEESMRYRAAQRSLQSSPTSAAASIISTSPSQTTGTKRISWRAKTRCSMQFISILTVRGLRCHGPRLYAEKMTPSQR